MHGHLNVKLNKLLTLFTELELFTIIRGNETEYTY